MQLPAGGPFPGYSTYKRQSAGPGSCKSRTEALQDLFRLPKAEDFDATPTCWLASGLPLRCPLRHKTTYACTPARERRCCCSSFKFASSRGPPTRPAISFAVLEASRTYCFPASCRFLGPPFSSFPPEVDAGPQVRFGAMPVVSGLGFAELVAGSPVMLFWVFSELLLWARTAVLKMSKSSWVHSLALALIIRIMRAGS
jgi:hypothetical protein